MMLDVSTSFIQDLCFWFCTNACQLFVKGRWFASFSDWLLFTDENTKTPENPATHSGLSSHNNPRKQKKLLRQVPARIYQRDVTDTFTKSRGIVERIALIVPSRLSQIRTTNHIQSARSNSDLVECLTVKLWHPWFHSLAGAHFGSPHPAPGLLQHILCRAVVPQTLELKRNRKFII